MNYKINYKSFNFLEIGRRFFHIGIFLLPSAFSFSVILLIISAFLSSLNYKYIFKEKWNYPFFAVGILMLIRNILLEVNLFESNNSLILSESNWIDLLNWIPLIWIFSSFQIYLKKKNDREICSGLLLAGTVPIIVSGFAQYFLGWHGPFEAFNGLIVWYQKSIEERGYNSLTGPFNNQNYAGAWLVTILPICFFKVKKHFHIKYKRIIFLIFLIVLFIGILLTNSRNAILASFLSIPIMLGVSYKIWLIGFIFIFSFLISIIIFESPLEILRPLRKSKIIESFIPDYDLRFKDFLNFTRIKIWKNAISSIMQRPFLGWGASSFSVIYMLNNKDFIFLHTHNLLLEVSHNYGIIISIILFTSIFQLMRKTNKQLFSKQSSILKKMDYPNIDKYWWTSSFLILFIHLSDVTYYDGRISILFWLLLSGLVMNLRETT